MRIVIVTGMSGAGKSTALDMLEDAGYYCVDNLPILLIPKFIEIMMPNEELSKIALGVDIRGGQQFEKLEEIFQELREHDVTFEVLFLDCGDDVLVKRYKETRRNHPLAGKGRIEDGIRMERKRMQYVKKQADYILDTSQMLTRELKKELQKIFVQNLEYKNIYITVLSFGFKYGIPTDADLVFDVRFLPNPYYNEELRPFSGNDQVIRDYVMKNRTAQTFRKKLCEMLEFLIPNYEKEGKNQLVIGIGCTGGKHRSVTVANELYEYLSERGEYGIKIEHRDLEKDATRKAH